MHMTTYKITTCSQRSVYVNLYTSLGKVSDSASMGEPSQGIQYLWNCPIGPIFIWVGGIAPRSHITPSNSSQTGFCMLALADSSADGCADGERERARSNMGRALRMAQSKWDSLSGCRLWAERAHSVRSERSERDCLKVRAADGRWGTHPASVWAKYYIPQKKKRDQMSKKTHWTSQVVWSLSTKQALQFFTP